MTAVHDQVHALRPIVDVSFSGGYGSDGTALNAVTYVEGATPLGGSAVYGTSGGEINVTVEPVSVDGQQVRAVNKLRCHWCEGVLTESCVSSSRVPANICGWMSLEWT